MERQQQRGFQPKNKEMFGRGSQGPSIYNGYGTTRTPPAPTLFVTNIPAGASAVEVEALFKNDDGFDGVRTVRHMIFVDFYDVRSATNAMRQHQNTFLPGFEVEQGIMIDFDKDPRHKRNKAFTASRDRGAFQHGFGGGVHMAAAPVQRPPRDPTLDLINEIKRKHRQEQGVPVPLHEDGSTSRKRARQAGPGNGSHRGARKSEKEEEAVSFALPPAKQSLLALGEDVQVQGKLIRKKRKQQPQGAEEEGCGRDGCNDKGGCGEGGGGGGDGDGDGGSNGDGDDAGDDDSEGGKLSGLVDYSSSDGDGDD